MIFELVGVLKPPTAFLKLSRLRYFFSFDPSAVIYSTAETIYTQILTTKNQI